MALPLLALPMSALVLEGLLLWRLSKHRLWQGYPYLTVFVVYDSLSNLVLFPVNRFKPDWFAGVYWRIESISIFLRFLIAWEFFRAIFVERSTLRDLAWRVLLTVEIAALPAMLILSWGQESSLQHHLLRSFSVVEQYFSLAQVAVLLVPAAVAWYYRIPLNRNLWGLGFGFGIYLLVRAVNFASIQVFHKFFPYLRLLAPLTLIGMLAVWLWAFWHCPAAWEQSDVYGASDAEGRKEYRVGPFRHTNGRLRQGMGT